MGGERVFMLTMTVAVWKKSEHQKNLPRDIEELRGYWKSSYLFFILKKTTSRVQIKGKIIIRRIFFLKKLQLTTTVLKIDYREEATLLCNSVRMTDEWNCVNKKNQSNSIHEMREMFI